MTLNLTIPPRQDVLTELPVIVIGAGPVGLAAAAQVLERGIRVRVLESGPGPAAAIRQWGHTRLFSPWEFLVDSAAARLLEQVGWARPDGAALPLGHELVDEYLVPLAQHPALAPHISYLHDVIAVSRRGKDRTRSTDRSSTPFAVRVRTSSGIHDILARAVIDASGTYGQPNGLSSNGLDPIGIETVRDSITHALPDVLERDRESFAGKRILVVGAGHSAANTLLKLAELKSESPDTDIVWAIRNANPSRAYGSADDELEARGRLGGAAHELVRSGAVTLVDEFEIDELEPADGELVLASGRRASTPFSLTVDVIVNATGFRPNLGMLREIRLALDDVVEAPRALAPLIDPNLHSCGTVSPHGVAELAHPEPNFFIVGMKSYGRAPTFLLVTGYEQVRSIADELAGDPAAARRVQLVLPETGVCSTDISGDGSCCSAPAPVPVQLTH